MERLGDLVKTVDRHIKTPLLDVEETHVTGRQNIQSHVRGFLADSAEHPWHQAGFRVVAGHDPEHALTFHSRERGFFVNCLLNIGKDATHQWLQLRGTLGRCHTLTGTNQQRVPEQVPQSAQTVAHRGLGNPKMIRSLGDVPFPQQYIEINKQVQVYPGNVHEVAPIGDNTKNGIYSLE